MEHRNVKTAKDFNLPLQIIGRNDINRLLRELETLESALLKIKGSASLTGEEKTLLRVTDELTQAASVNSYDLKTAADRQDLLDNLTKIRDQAPLLHISFATEPSPKVTETLLGWLRSNIHRYTLLRIGLQPAIAAGCILRTPNKVFDLSLKSSFEKQKTFLKEVIKSTGEGGMKK